MNTFSFIHTIELCRSITYKEHTHIKENLNFIPAKEELYKVWSKDYIETGIDITIVQKSKKESQYSDKEKTHKLLLIINPSRLKVSGSYTNEIKNFQDFENALSDLDMQIKKIFSNFIPSISGINSFKIQRVDITRDIFNISEKNIPDFLTTLYKLPLHAGYKINKTLQINTMDFVPQKSFNIINDSQGVEFVLYDKHSSTVSRNYPEDVQKVYTNVLRLELRCSRKYIKKHYSASTFDSLCKIYIVREEILTKIYSAIFYIPTDACFLSRKLLFAKIEKYCGSKHKKESKMKAFCNLSNLSCDMSQTNRLPINSFGFKRCYTILEYFNDIGCSPIYLPDSTPFIQSLDSLLEFFSITDVERENYEYCKKHTRGKEILLHDI